MESTSQTESITKHSDREEEILETLRLVEGSNLWSITYRRIRKDTLGMIGFSIVVLLVLVAIFAFLIQQYDALFGLSNPSGDPWDLHNYFIEIWIPGTSKYIRLIAHPKHILAGDEITPPNLQYPFGTDALGHDIFSRMIFGTPLSLTLGLVGQIFTTLIGTVVGAVSGFYGGAFDTFVQRINEIIIGLPDFILFIFAVSLFRDIGIFNFEGAYYIVVLTILGLIQWGGISLIVRSTVLSLKAREFVEAERALGAKDVRIVFRHILPNALSPIIIITTLGIAGTIMSITGLAFFGFGDPTAVSWGDDLAAYRDVLLTYWWMPTFPALMIFVTMLGFNLMGDALRDALDPKLK
ncbi:MAG: ABC transporter permease [Candidatus Heimdallarchaeota archaeon]|nr:ABC transporter permease [Candidatus Heimdallarchaeota archaeon]MBY8994598.1 ABC transporter permease [Candidatus Heimdallarchaeota archaeon]